MLTDPRTSQLAASCKQTAEIASEAVTWLEANAERVGRDAQALIGDLRRAYNAARKMEVAVRRPMCVGVFGPSQAGKSFLISALARHGTEPLLADFAGEGVDFAESINPSGGRESTGLVTRFTLAPGLATPPGFPVQLRLLTQTDVVKIIGNTFYLDGDPNHFEVPEPAALRERLTALAERAAAGPVDRLSEDDVFELQEYFERNFATAALVRALGGFYWNQAARLAPRLTLADRAALFAVLWADIAPFTAMYKRLVGALAQLDHATEAFVPLTALVPKERSIIDVRRLYELGDDDGERLEVATQGPGGLCTVALPRAEVTAIVAELRIVMRQKPFDFFEHTDLLDFPGARSREMIRDIGYEATKKGMMEQLFLRGKVAYLFDRYCAERELTAMLLCVGPSTQEVKSLPEMVRNWIVTTHGDTAAKRTGKTTALFLVLTMFDTMFERAKGKDDEGGSPGERWTARLQSSLLDFFGKRFDWPGQWDARGAFRNCFWLRNPNVAATGLIDYDQEALARKVYVELGLRDTERERVDQLRRAYLDNATVRQHFADPLAAWNAALALNDGGVSYLAEKLRPVCNPDLKRRQIEADLAEWRQHMADRLVPFHVSSDLEREREKKRKLAKQVAGRLVACASAQRFGELLVALQVAEEELDHVYYRVEGLANGNGAPGGVTVGVAADRAAMLRALGLAEEGGSQLMDQADRFADASVALWVEKLGRLADDRAQTGYLQMPTGDMSRFVHELVASAERINLKGSIAERVRQHSKYRNIKWDRVIDKLVVIAANQINGFIDWLGFDASPEALRPHVKANGAERGIFAPRPPVGPVLKLAETASRFDEAFYVDWIAAFMRLVEDNVAGQSEAGFDVEQNSRLGTILESLQGAAA